MAYVFLPVFVMTFAAYEHCAIRHTMAYVFLPVVVMTFAANTVPLEMLGENNGLNRRRRTEEQTKQ